MTLDFKDEFNSLHNDEKQKTPTEYKKLKNSELLKRDLDSYPEKLKNDALKKLDILAQVSRKLTSGLSEKKLNPILDEIFSQDPDSRPSARTVIRWFKKYNDSDGDLTSLVVRNHKMGNREIKNKDDEVFFHEALSRFLDAKRPSVARAYEFYKDSIIIENENIVSGKVPILSYDGFLKRIRKLPPYPVAVARHGKFLADQWFSYTSSHQPPTRVLERVEIDHTPLDLILIDDKLGIPLGRPYLTLLIDVFSGCILGYHLSYKAPSYVSVAKAISHAIKPKGDINTFESSIVNDWPCHGKIETLVVDNGAEFWSKSLEHACQETQINIQYNPVRKPWLKPFVERFFGMINQYFLAEIPGKTFSNIIAKEDYKPEKDAIMRFSTFVNEFHRWIVDIFHQDSDSRLKRIPMMRWKQSVKSLPPIVMTDEELDHLNIIMAVKDSRTLTPHGIKFENLFYDSSALSEYRKTYPQTKNNLKKLIKVDPDDLSKIYVYLEELEGYLEVPCTDRSGYVNDLSLHEHKVIQKYNREVVKENINALGLAKARMAMHEVIKNEQEAFLKSPSKRRVKSAGKLAKLADVSNTGSGTIKSDKKQIADTKENDKKKLSNFIDSWSDNLDAFE